VHNQTKMYLNHNQIFRMLKTFQVDYQSQVQLKNLLVSRNKVQSVIIPLKKLVLKTIKTVMQIL